MRHYRVRIQQSNGCQATTLQALPSDDAVEGFAAGQRARHPGATVEWLLVGEGQPQFRTHTGRAFWTAAQLASYHRGYQGFAPARTEALDDFSQVGRADAEREDSDALDRRCAEAE